MEQYGGKDWKASKTPKKGGGETTTFEKHQKNTYNKHTRLTDETKDGVRKKELIIIWDKVLFILTPELLYRLHSFNFFL